jgi:hypothetical protein
MKKILFVICILFLVGCSSKKLDKAYQTILQIDDNIDSYTMDLRIYGNLNNKKVNEIVKIKNTKDTYEIDIKNNEDITTIHNIDNYIYDSNSNVNKIYVIAGKTYIVNDNKYVRTTNEVKYDNPSIYLEALNYIENVYSIGEEKIGEQLYKRYSITLNRKTMNDIISDTTLNNITVNKNTNANVYLDKKNHLYKIIYYLKDLTISVSYFEINEDTYINLPIEI